MPKTETKETCKECGKEFLRSEVKRIYGKESSVLLLNLCSARCYTKKLTGI